MPGYNSIYPSTPNSHHLTHITREYDFIFIYGCSRSKIQRSVMDHVTTSYKLGGSSTRVLSIASVKIVIYFK